MSKLFIFLLTLTHLAGAVELRIECDDRWKDFMVEVWKGNEPAMARRLDERGIANFGEVAPGKYFCRIGGENTKVRAGAPYWFLITEIEVSGVRKIEKMRMPEKGIQIRLKLSERLLGRIIAPHAVSFQIKETGAKEDRLLRLWHPHAAVNDEGLYVVSIPGVVPGRYRIGVYRRHLEESTLESRDLDVTKTDVEKGVLDVRWE